MNISDLTWQGTAIDVYLSTPILSQICKASFLCFILISSSSKCIPVPLWCSRLRIQPCHCSGSGPCCGHGLNPWPRNFHMLQVQPKKKKKNSKTITVHLLYFYTLVQTTGISHLNQCNRLWSDNEVTVNEVFLKLSDICFPLNLGWNPTLIRIHKTSKAWPSFPTIPLLTYNTIVTPTFFCHATHLVCFDGKAFLPICSTYSPNPYKVPSCPH